MDTVLLVVLVIAIVVQGFYPTLAHKRGPPWLIWLRYLCIVPLALGIVCLCLPLSAYPENTPENTPELIAKALACGSFLFTTALIVGYPTFEACGRWSQIAVVAGFVVPLSIIIPVGVEVGPLELVWGVLGVGPGAVSVFLGCTWWGYKKSARRKGRSAKQVKEERRIFAASALTGLFSVVSVILTILLGCGKLTSPLFAVQCGLSIGTFIVLIILLRLAVRTGTSPRPQTPASGGQSSTTGRGEHEMTGYGEGAVEASFWV